ncbi:MULTISPECIES: hypothetical protein [Actibacterium]|uniref:Uncharacterized protein n=1 Tax=Actibacterium naphthalenivorans TaxID=1614693 RepID=A0A840CIC0_9RHOB|nr:MULTISPECIES: hypothetical protein [Actibacterium]ALG91164.1 hypothetical protein TQ29_14420 [Actibacterium sp. EMB200-NS6]MBB4022516.1 hypothetical protein [Actibacterium naphthalenivorans]
MSDKENSNKPVQTHRYGPIEVAIWQKDTDDGPVFNTERTRSYRDKDGSWQKSHSIPEKYLLTAARLDQKAFEAIQQIRDQEREKRLGRLREDDQSRQPRSRLRRRERDDHER